MRCFGWIYLAVEAILLVAFVSAGHHADTFLPEFGGDGNGAKIGEYNGLAAAAFWLLVALWLVAILMESARPFIANNPSAFWKVVTLPTYRSAIALPLVGVVGAYVGLLLGIWTW